MTQATRKIPSQDFSDRYSILILLYQYFQAFATLLSWGHGDRTGDRFCRSTVPPPAYNKNNTYRHLGDRGTLFFNYVGSWCCILRCKTHCNRSNIKALKPAIMINYLQQAAILPADNMRQFITIYDLFIWDVLNNIFYVTTDNLTQRFYSNGRYRFATPKPLYRVRKYPVFVDKRICRYSLFFNSPPKRGICHHRSYLVQNNKRDVLLTMHYITSIMNMDFCILL